jgi:hypothetical protein
LSVCSAAAVVVSTVEDDAPAVFAPQPANANKDAVITSRAAMDLLNIFFIFLPLVLKNWYKQSAQ